jgi:glucan phosphoethanolaminetransferase (alkaline phosphatase superfamily)
MKPTTFKNIMSFVLLAVIVGYLIPNIYENLTATYIPVSSNTVIALLLLNLSLLYWIVIFKNRLKDARKKNQDISKRKSPPHPLVAARTVALAFAGSRAASLILGFILEQF